MELKPLKHYYSEHLKRCLRDGDNKYIKDYTTYGFKKSYQMWNDYSHDSIKAFFDDFMKEYSEDFLKNNCEKCYTEMRINGSSISYDDLFDILLRRLVIDAFIGFKAEDIIRQKLISDGYDVHNYNVISRYEEALLDTKYGVDILAFKNNKLMCLIQVKNTSTFSHDGKYIKEKRMEFFDKELEANEHIKDNDLIDNEYRNMIFYVYDKNAYINEGKFKYYVNPKRDKCNFLLYELCRKDGTLKNSVKNFKSREL